MHFLVVECEWLQFETAVLAWTISENSQKGFGTVKNNKELVGDEMRNYDKVITDAREQIWKECRQKLSSDYKSVNKYCGNLCAAFKEKYSSTRSMKIQQGDVLIIIADILYILCI